MDQILSEHCNNDKITKQRNFKVREDYETDENEYGLLINAPVRMLKLTPLHVAALHGSPEQILRLVEFGANINAVDSAGRTALWHAAGTGRADAVGALLAAKAADIPWLGNDDATDDDLDNSTIEDGTTAWGHVLFAGDVAVAEEFLKHRPWLANESISCRSSATGFSLGGDANDDGIRPVHVAASLGLDSMLRLLRKYYADMRGVDGQGRTALMYAAVKGRLETLKTLMEVSPEDEKSGPPKILIPGWKEEMIDYVFHKTCDVNAADYQGWRALHYASVSTKNQPIQSLEYLMSLTPIHNPQERRYLLTPLHMAAKAGSFEILKTLLSSNLIDAGLTTKDDRTALCFAAHAGHLKCVETLIGWFDERRSTSGIMSDNGLQWSSRRPPYSRVTPLHMTLRSRIDPTESVKILLQAGTDSTIDANIPTSINIQTMHPSILYH